MRRRALIRANLSHAHFEFVRISDLQTSAGQQSRRGKAEFRVFIRGSFDRQGSVSGMTDVGTQVTTWSLGFQETEPGIWKVNRISPVSMPQGILALPGGLPPTDDSHLGLNDGIGLPRTPGSMGRGSRRSGLRPRRLLGEIGNRGRPSRIEMQPLAVTCFHIQSSIAVGLVSSRGGSLVEVSSRNAFTVHSTWYSRMISLCSFSS